MFDHYDAHGLPVACDKAEAEIRELRADEARWEETVGDLNEKVIQLTRAVARAEETAAEALAVLDEIRQGVWALEHVRHAQDAVRRARRILRGQNGSAS